MSFQNPLIHLLVAMGMACICPAFVGSQSIQALGFPTPAATEIVFPYIVFGNSPAKIVTEIIVMNSTENDAYIELDLFGPQGLPPALLFVPDPHTKNTFTGRITTFVAAKSMATLTYPSLALRGMVAPMFTGWTTLVSNEPITVFQKIKVLDPESDRVLSEISFFGNSRPALTAEFLARFNTGGPPRNTGIALVNPSEQTTAKLSMQLLNSQRQVILEKEIELPPRWQKQVVAADFFGITTPQADSRLVRVRSKNSMPFAVLAADYGLYSSGAGRGERLFLLLPPPFDRVSLEQLSSFEFSNKPWNFPVPVVTSETVADLGIVLTRMGFFLVGADGNRPGPFKITLGKGIKANAQMGIALVEGEFLDKSVIFVPKRKVVRERMHGRIDQIVELPEKGKVEVKSSGIVDLGLILTVNSYLLLDTEKAEVLGRFSGPFSQPPPWRR